MGVFRGTQKLPSSLKRLHRRKNPVKCVCVCVYPLVLSANVRPLECVLVCVPLLEPLHAFKTLLKILQGCRYTQWTVWSKGSVRVCVCVGVGWEAYSICMCIYERPLASLQGSSPKLETGSQDIKPSH